MAKLSSQKQSLEDVSVTFLVAETGHQSPGLRRGKVYFAHSLQRFRFIVGWFPGRAARQRGITEQKQTVAGRQEEEAVAAAVAAAACLLSVPFHSTQATILVIGTTRAQAGAP